MSKRAKKTLSDLTWAELEAWAGSRIVSRGKSYQKSGSVRDLARTSDGGLLAWVRGSRNYATKAALEKGRLSSDCTCPYEGTCKHAVAVVLEYLDCLKKKADVPLANVDDDRLSLLEDASLAWEDHEDCVDFDEDDDEYRDEDDDLIPEAERALAGIEAALGKKSKQELQATLSGILKSHPELKKELGFARPTPGKKGCAALTKSVTKAIVMISSEPAWRDYWKHTGQTPDYSPVRDGLKRLLDEGCPDDVVRLGEKLFTRGVEQLEHSHDEGETATELSDTMPIVFKALAKCSLSDTDKLERAVDFVLRDDYDLCRGADEFLQRRFGKKSWSELADRLLTRLREMKPETGEGAFSRDYNRDHLSGEVIRAMENAGRADEAIGLCLREAEATGSYERLVRKLRQADRTAEAEEWIRKGVKETQNKLPGIAASLKSALLEMRQEKKDWPFVSALRAEDFFQNPGLKTFKDLQTACARAKAWPEVRSACMVFLETGVYPGDKAGWPLPDTGFGKPEKLRREKPPFTDTLIDIAISEKRIDDVLRWYDIQKQRANAWFGSHRDDVVANAVTGKYPDRAIAIWKTIAEGLIAQAKVGAYSEAVAYLKKVRQALDRTGRAAEWASYLAALTEANKRKPRLVEMLNVLSNKPIITK